jgi:protein gp37
MKNNFNFTEAVRDAYEGKTPILDYDEFQAPLRRKKPAKIGLQFMGDLLHDSIDGFVISSIWEVMKNCSQHTFFILTKRPERFLKLTPPLPVLENIWFGVSVEDQKTADERIPILLQIPAVHRWVSIEPMLEEINFKFTKGDYKGSWLNALDWVVLGGETGPKARPMHPDWVRSIRDQCQSASTPFFFKSWGEWQPVDNEGFGHP